MKFDSSPKPDLPTTQQLAELRDALISTTELQQLYAALAQHPRVRITPGSGEIFAACHEQVGQDMAVLDEQLGGLVSLAHSAPIRYEEADEEARSGIEPPPRDASFPDIEPADPQKSVFETVRRAFHLEDFLRQQLVIALQSAQERHHQKFELQLKMIILSAEQRCRLLEERYGFARSRSLIFQGLRKQTTRFLSRLQGVPRHDID
jgi:hypothetical protein